MTPLDPPTGPAPSQPGPDESGTFEVDHTGIRALLQGLPDPGPMPADLVARIETRLAVEQSHRALGQASAGSGQGSTSGPGEPGHLTTRSDTLVDLAAERSRRRPGRTLVALGAAAAGLLVTTVALSQVLDGPGIGGDTAAYAPAGDRATTQGADDAREGGAEAAAGDDSAGGESAAQDEAGTELDAAAAATEDAGADSAGGAPALEAAPERMGDEFDGLVPAASLGEVADDFGAQLKDATPSVAASTADGTQLTTSELTAAQANSCWRSVPEDGPSWATRAAASGTRAGEQVVVLLGLDDSGAGRSWLMPWSCVDGPVDPLDDVVVNP
ncbi:hypothetical protein [Ornithinimicrobium panacihumi]|uniref:hypothetical protein n=1 Tax=Ornithinimicrobium panacihumi TaxID=2008449 RepID=UPI003F8C9AFE